MKRDAEAPGAGPATSPLAGMKWLEGSERQAALEHNAQIAARTTPPWAHRTCEPRPSGGQSQIIRSSGSEQDSVGTREKICADVAKRIVEDLAELDEWAKHLSPKKRRFMQGNASEAQARAPAAERTMTIEERRVWTAWMKEEEEKEKQRELRDLARMDSRGPTTTDDHAKTQDATMTEHDAELLAFMIDPDAYVLARG